MSAQLPYTKQEGKHFTALSLDSLTNLGQLSFKHPAISKEVEGKFFLKSILGLTSCEVSLNKLPPKAYVPFYHKHHENEELYIFIQGRGQFEVDGEIIPIEEGTVIRVATEGERTWKNDSDEDLYYIVIQAKANSFSGDTIQDGYLTDKKVSRSKT